MTEPRKPLHHHVSDYFFPHARNDHRPHIFSYASIIAIAVTIIVSEIGYVTQTKYVFLNTDFLASVLPSVLADLTNTARAESGLALVTHNPILDKAAEAAAQDMAAKGYFSHVAPDGTTPWYWLDQAGYAYSYAGQNLAVNFTDSENVQTAWLASPTHRENIMKREYTEVGFGTATGMYEGQETTFVVEFFATPRTVAAAKPSIPAKITTAKKTSPVAVPSVLGAELKQATSSVSTTSPHLTLPTARTEPIVPLPDAMSFRSLAASPLTALEMLLTALLAIIALSYGFAVVMKGKLQHPSVVYGGAFLMFLISAALIGSALIAGPIILTDAAQVASASAAF